MYKALVKEYVKKISLEDINNFALKNNIPVKKEDCKILYDFIKSRWEEIYDSNNFNFNCLKGKISDELLDNIYILYNKYKSFIKK